MDLVDYGQYASPMDGDTPSGPDLEYDPDFLKIIDALAPPAVTMVAGSEDASPDQTNWADAVELGQSLLGKTRDMRVAVRLGRCAINSEQGIAGLAGAINLASALLDGMWDDVHPVLDADDNMDATMRLNALNELGGSAVVKAVANAPIARVGRQFVTLHDIELSIGKAPANSADEQNEASAKISEVFAPSNEDKVETALALVEGALRDIEAIGSTWAEKMDALNASRSEEDLAFDNMPPPQFEGLTRALNDISRHIKERLPQGAVDLEDDAEAGGAVKKTASGAITTRADADRAILNIVEWFRRNEPSSPVPIMLERARTMISKSFMEIVDDLGEGGIAEVKKATGAPNVTEPEQ